MIFVTCPRRVPMSTRKLALVFTAILALALCAHHTRLRLRAFNRSPAIQTDPPCVQGRWKSVRASLGLPPLPDRVLPSALIPAGTSSAPPHTLVLSRLAIASRFDLKRKRSLEELSSRTVVPLFFAPDALERRSISLEEFLGSSHAPLAERQQIATLKENSWRARAARLMDIRQGQSNGGGTT